MRMEREENVTSLGGQKRNVNRRSACNGSEIVFYRNSYAKQ